MVEVFKTNVHCAEAAAQLLQVLRHRWAACQVSFDLDDCDRVLRIAGPGILTEQVILLVQQYGFECFILD